MSDQCPCCGSTDTEVVQEQWDYTPPFGGTVKYPHRFLRCNTCTESISWNTEEDDAIGEKIRLDADKATVGPMLDALNKRGLVDVEIDRLLRIGIGTIRKRWREGDITSSEITLLRLLYTFPWLLLVTDHNFEPEYINKVIDVIDKAFKEEAEREVLNNAPPTNHDAGGSKQDTSDEENVHGQKDTGD